LREVGRIQVGGEVGLQPPLGFKSALQILHEPICTRRRLPGHGVFVIDLADCCKLTRIQ
jgi:hypothetical protein